MIIGLKITEERGEETEGRFCNVCEKQKVLLQRTQSLFLQMVSFLSFNKGAEKARASDLPKVIGEVWERCSAACGAACSQPS